jgi:hypothetical protein
MGCMIICNQIKITTSKLQQLNRILRLRESTREFSECRVFCPRLSKQKNCRRFSLRWTGQGIEATREAGKRKIEDDYYRNPCSKRRGQSLCCGFWFSSLNVFALLNLRYSYSQSTVIRSSVIFLYEVFSDSSFSTLHAQSSLSAPPADFDSLDSPSVWLSAERPLLE